jgi:hypothetical protein
MDQRPLMRYRLGARREFFALRPPTGGQEESSRTMLEAQSGKLPLHGRRGRDPAGRGKVRTRSPGERDGESCSEFRLQAGLMVFRRGRLPSA